MSPSAETRIIIIINIIDFMINNALQFLRSQSTFRVQTWFKMTRYGILRFHTSLLLTLSLNKKCGMKLQVGRLVAIYVQLMIHSSSPGAPMSALSLNNINNLERDSVTMICRFPVGYIENHCWNR